LRKIWGKNLTKSGKTVVGGRKRFKKRGSVSKVIKQKEFWSFWNIISWISLKSKKHLQKKLSSIQNTFFDYGNDRIHRRFHRGLPGLQLRLGHQSCWARCRGRQITYKSGLQSPRHSLQTRLLPRNQFGFLVFVGLSCWTLELRDVQPSPGRQRWKPQENHHDEELWYRRNLFLGRVFARTDFSEWTRSEVSAQRWTPDPLSPRNQDQRGSRCRTWSRRTSSGFSSGPRFEKGSRDSQVQRFYLGNYCLFSINLKVETFSRIWAS